MRLALICLFILVASCAPPPPSPEEEFNAWLAAAPERSGSFQRFEAMLRREGVSGVVPDRDLWLTDRKDPQCVIEPYTMPPEDVWTRIVPALQFVRDHVKPAIGDVAVASSFRDEALNECVHGARLSAHRNFYALDLVPVDAAVSRERLIETLCPIHAREGPRSRIGLGIYRARRFHVDARGYRGWGEDFHGATFPCRSDSG